jgi:hypothetical protein
MPTSNMKILLHIVRLNAIYFNITVHESVTNCAALFPVAHTEKELSYFLFFLFIVWEEMYNHSSVVLVCECVHCYHPNNISLQNLFTK